MKSRKTHFVFFRNRVTTRPKASGRFSVPRIFKKIRLIALELTYLPHLLLRFPHDHLYHKTKVYRRYSDHPATEVVHRAALSGFLVSLLVFMALQYALPGTFDFVIPSGAKAAGVYSKWTTNTDFTNNTSTTNTATTPSGVNITSDSVTLLSTGGAATKTETFQIPAGVTSLNVTIVGGGGGGGGGGYMSDYGAPGTRTTMLYGSTVGSGTSYWADGGTGGSPDGGFPVATNGITSANSGWTISTAGNGGFGGGGGSAGEAGGNGGSGGMLSKNGFTVIPGFWITITNGVGGTGGADGGDGGAGGAGGAGGVTVSYSMPITYAPTTGTISGLMFDSGVGVQTRWGQLNWTSLALPTSTDISFRVATSDTNNGSDWSWSSYFTQNTAGSTAYNADLSARTKSRYLLLELTLHTSNSANAPTLNDFTLSALDAPANMNVVRHTGGGALTNANGNNWTSESSVDVKANIPSMSPIPMSPSGTVTSAASGTLVDNTKTWTTNEYANATVTITGGTGSGQTRTIASNTATSLGLITGWATIPNTSSTYLINYEILTPQIELISPSSGSFANSSAAGNYYNGATMTTANGGVTYTSGGITYTPVKATYTGAATGYNFGQISGLTSGATYKVQLRFLDNFGRLGPWNTTITLNTFTVDTVAPAETTNPYLLKATSALLSNYIKPSDTYYIYANASDALSGVSTVTANVATVTTGSSAVAMATSGGPWTVDGVSYAYRSAQLTANAGLTSGSKATYLTTTDNAGNTFTNASAYSITADAVAPTITSITSTNTTGTYYKEGGEINVTANFSEVVTTTVNVGVTLNSGGSCSFAVSGAASGSCTYTVGSGQNASPLNSASITGTLTDRAGNTMSSFTPSANLSASKTLVVDTVAPAETTNPYLLKATSALLSNYIKPSDTYYIYANASDALSGVSTVTANVATVTTGSSAVAMATSGGPWTVDGVSYAYRSAQLTANAGLTSGSKATYLTTTDNAGNTFTNASAYSITADAVAPTITSITSTNTTGTYYKEGGEINVTANFSEVVTTTVNVGVTLNSGGSCSFAVSGAASGSCTYTVGSGQNASPLNSASITGTLTDRAGNTMSSFTPSANLSASKTLVVDTVAPAEATAPTSDNYANNTGTETLSWEEFFDSAPSSGFGSYTLQRRKLPSMSYTDIYVVSSSSTVTTFTDSIADGSGTYFYRLVTADMAGNTVTSPDSLGVIVDNTAPGGTIQINADYRAVGTGTVDLSFTLTDDFSGVYSYEVDNGDDNWQNYTDIAASDLLYSGTITSWNLLDPLVEGTKTVRIKLFDKAGNSVTNITDTIFLDLTSPDSINPVAAYSDSGMVTPISETGYSNGWYNHANPYFKFIATDQISGIKEFQYCVYGEDGSCNYGLKAPLTASKITAEEDPDHSYIAGTSVAMSEYGEGIFTIKVVGYDFAGRASTEASYVYSYDTSLPGNVSSLEASPSVNLAVANNSIAIRWRKMNPQSDIAPVEKYRIERIEANSFVINQVDHTSVPAYNGDWSSTTGYGSITCLAAAPYSCIDKDGSNIGNATYDGTYFTYTEYANMPENSSNPYTDLSLDPSTRYVFRVMAKDYANSAGGGLTDEGFGSIPNSPDYAIYGYTKDNAAPELAPTNVTAAACDTGDATNCLDGDIATYRGHEVKVSWDKAQDNVSGIGFYYIYRHTGASTEMTGWSIVGKVAEGESYYNVYKAADDTVIANDYDDPASWVLVGDFDDPSNDVTNSRRIFWDTTVTDATRYSYRIVAYDQAEPGVPNHTAIAADIFYLDTTNAYPAVVPNTGILVPDVTAPILPSDFSARNGGIEYSKSGCLPYVDGTECQQASISWTQTNDNTVGTGITYKLFQSVADTSSFVELTDEEQHSTSYDPEDPSAPSQEELLVYNFKVSGLYDLTNYYFKIQVSDGFGNIVESGPVMMTTGNSAAPTAPANVNVNNNNSNVTDAAHQLYVLFSGSYAPKFNQATKANGIVRYDVYMTRTNKNPDVDGSITPADNSDDCTTDELTDDCWIRINNAGSPIRTESLATPIGDDLLNQYGFLATNLQEASEYYFRVRATDNTTPDALTGPLSDIPVISASTIHNSGWDITRDLTAPELPQNGLEVQVKDTYPNSTTMRNIVNWKILAEQPLRPKLGYEESTTDGGTCSLVVIDGTSYCNDFYAYEIYRQIKDANGNIIEASTTLVRTETDSEANYFIDEISNTELIDGMGEGALLTDQKITYYVQVVDASYVNFGYPGGTHINASENKSAKQYSGNTIIPSKATPSVEGAVTISNVGVASASISWNTDQDTDALVEFREKYLRNGDGSVNRSQLNTNGSYMVIGANTNPGESTDVQQHTVNLFGLRPNTPYDYRIVSHNYLGNNVDTTGITMPGLETIGFTVTPGSVVTTTTGATINWTTNLDADSAFVEYQMNLEGNDEPQGKTVGVNPSEIVSSPREHTVVISGLKSNRSYSYKIKSISKDGFVAEAGSTTFETKTFDTAAFTLAPSSSNVDERNITATSAQIVWQTAVPTTNWVRYGTESGNYAYAAGDNGLSTSHAVKIDGLIPGTSYFYIIDVKDANDTPYTSQEYTFTAVLKPKISNFKVEETTPYAFTITWDTNIDTETMINLGKDTAYGQKRGTSGWTKVHKLVVDGLDDNTEYHFQIIAKDETGYEVADEDKIVRTPMDRIGPRITSVKVDVLPMAENDANSSVIISWQTDKPATTLVEYDPGIIGGTYNSRSVEDSALSGSHTVIVKGLTPASSYHYRLVSRDKRGNETISQDYTFVTPSKEKSILQLILKSLEETFAWTKNLNQFFANIGKRLTGKS